MTSFYLTYSTSKKYDANGFPDFILDLKTPANPFKLLAVLFKL